MCPPDCAVVLVMMKLTWIFINSLSSQVIITFKTMENLQSKNFMSSWKKAKDFVLRDFVVPTNYVLLSHTNNYEASKDFHNFFVLSSNNQSWNHGKPTIEKLYVIYRNHKQARSEGNIGTFQHEKAREAWWLKLQSKSF